MTKSNFPTCPACRSGHLHPAERIREFNPNGKSIQVALLTTRCDQCGAERTFASQHKENLARLAARKVHYGKLLMGEEILALRQRYGLTQQNASIIFGKGIIAFSRYENEVTFPDDSTTLLLQLAIESPTVMKSLADKAGIELPLWAARCEDEQRVKLHLLPTTYQTTPAGLRNRAHFGVRSASAKAIGGFPNLWATQVVPVQPVQQSASNEEQVSQLECAA